MKIKVTTTELVEIPDTFPQFRKMSPTVFMVIDATTCISTIFKSQWASVQRQSAELAFMQGTEPCQPAEFFETMAGAVTWLNEAAGLEMYNLKCEAADDEQASERAEIAEECRNDDKYGYLA